MGDALGSISEVVAFLSKTKLYMRQKIVLEIDITLSQEWPRNSLTEAALWAYIIGENQ